MSNVTLSKAVRSNLLHLQNTAKMMDITQERLATGKKVNSALDNPTNFFTASALTARSADIGTLLDAMSNGIRTIEAADHGLTTITKTIESMQSTLRQARQDKSFEVKSFALDANRSGEISFSGGVLGADGNVAVSLTNAIPASLTSGADYALSGTQGRQTMEFDSTNPIDFADPSDTITFNLSIDNGTQRQITITQAMVEDVLGDTEIDTPQKLGQVLQHAIEAVGIDPAAFSVEVEGDDIRIASGSNGSNSSIAISGITPGGTLTAGDLTGAGFDDWTSDDIGHQTSHFTIHYGSETLDVELNGDDHPTIASAIAEINARIEAHNSDPANEPINVTASADGQRIVLRGPLDGTGEMISVTDTDSGSGAANLVFGSHSPVPPSEADGPPKTVDQLVREINAATLPNGEPNPLKGAIRATNDNGKLRIENLSTQQLNISGIDASGNVTGDAESSDEILGNKIRANYANEFNRLRSELDRVAEDTHYNGINLLRGDQLKVIFNELGTSRIEIQARGADGEVRPINSSELGLFDLSASDLDLDDKIDELLHDLQLALGEVRSQASQFGSTLSMVQNRENFTKNMINTLETGAANLTLADTNEEAANMLALQTRQQLSQTALSLASQADQSVLRLFG